MEKTQIEIVKEIAYDAGKIVMEYYEKEDLKIKKKSDNSIVTEADEKSNEFIVESLKKKFSDDEIVSEEIESSSNSQGRVWYIDPIDGTNSFAAKTGQFAIHIGLCENFEPVLGVVYNPYTKEMFFASKNQGAFKEVNGKIDELKVININRELIGLMRTNKIVFEEEKSLLREYGILEYIQTGSEGLRFMKIVENRGDLRILKENVTHPWDICAPQIILEEAGGIALTIEGKKIKYTGERTIKDKCFFGNFNSKKIVFGS